MIHKRETGLLKLIPPFAGITISALGLIIYPHETATGIKNGLALLGDNIIPSLFPFMVLSSYISESNIIDFLAKILEKPTQKLFRINGNGLIAVILGFIGGYPIGAKTTSEFFNKGKLTENEAWRLFFWCVNPGPAFVITAVGTFMLCDIKRGLLLYSANILSSVTIGFFTRFLSDRQKIQNNHTLKQKSRDVFVTSVSTGSEAMLGICGWVLTFSAIASLGDCLISNENVSLFFNSILEVTTGCVYCTDNALPLPLISAVLGFGGFAVFFQIRKYMDMCNVQMKTFVCIRILNSALSAFFCSLLLNLFPQSTTTFSSIAAGNTTLYLSHSISASLILLIMCIVFIFEVDNKRKIC